MGTLNHDVRSGWWIGSWVDASGKQHRKRLSREETQARETLVLLEGEAARNRLLDIRPIQQVRFEVFAERFLEHCRVQIKAWRRYQTSLGSLIAFFGNRYLNGIDPELIEKYRVSRLKTVQKSTVNRDLQVLKRLYNVAIAWGCARENPVRLVKFFRESIGRLRYLTRAEFDRVLEHAPEDLKPLIIVAVNTGMRQAEMLNLNWADVDLENGFASLYDTKTSTPRKVPLNSPAKLAFLKMRLRGPGQQKVFVKMDGSPLPARTVQMWFVEVVKQAGIENFHFHDLRHTCASWLAMANVQIIAIKEILGHKDIRMTLRYSHLSPDHKVDAVRRLELYHQSRDIQTSSPTVSGAAGGPKKSSNEGSPAPTSPDAFSKHPDGTEGVA